MADPEEIISVLFETLVWPAGYVGALPKGIGEVMRKTLESFSVTFEDPIDRDLLLKICEDMNYTVEERDSSVENIFDQHGNLSRGAPRNGSFLPES